MTKIGNIVVIWAALSMATLSGCSMVSGWFGEDDEMDSVPELLDDGQAQQSWYCYGKGDGSGWQCEDKKTPSLITEIRRPERKDKGTKP